MNKKISRRTFLKGGMATIGLAACSSLFPFSFDKLTLLEASEENTGEMTFLNACPRDCYDTCSIISTVKDGVLKAINGNPANTYTNGHVCAKGYSYTRRVYSPDRIKYPMRQKGRGSGKWERISWDEAYTQIAKEILRIKHEYGSTLPICYNIGTGSMEILHNAPKGFFASIGYPTIAAGDPCWPAGMDAQSFDMGTIYCNDPETFVNSKYIILWGQNAAWTSIHSMHFIDKARKAGAKLVVIDPVLTSTASRADEYIQIKPASDGALALGMARHILDKKLYDADWLEKNAIGTEDFFQYLTNEVSLEWAEKESGVPKKVIARLAEEYATAKPANIWIGYGIQRHTNGGQMVRSIDALAALTGNIGKSGGGAQYGQLQTWGFNYNTTLQKPPANSGGTKPRNIDINNFAHDIVATQDPPIKMIWFASRSAVSQDPDPEKTRQALKKMDLVVTCDQFMTPTVAMSDIVLPVTTFFESLGVNVSYWQYWLSLNEKAIKPMYETKDDLQIAMDLSKKLNELEPGSCTFPVISNREDWLDKEFNPDVYKLFGISDWRELRKGPVKAKTGLVAWQDGKFETPSKKYEFHSELAKKYKHPAIPSYLPCVPQSKKYPLRYFSSHWPIGTNVQFQNLDWMSAIQKEPFLEIHPLTAQKYALKEGDKVKAYNDIGSITVPVHITSTVPPDMAITYAAWYKDNPNLANNLVKVRNTDMGSMKLNYPGTAFHDNFIEIKKINN